MHFNGSAFKWTALASNASRRLARMRNCFVNDLSDVQERKTEKGTDTERERHLDSHAKSTAHCSNDLPLSVAKFKVA